MTNVRGEVPSLCCPHRAGLTDISRAKIISLPDLSQAGQECVTGTAWINILTHGSHSNTQTHRGTQVHAHPYYRSMSPGKHETENKSECFKTDNNRVQLGVLKQEHFSFIWTDDHSARVYFLIKVDKNWLLFDPRTAFQHYVFSQINHQPYLMAK